jgi:hypothetical protein
LVESLKGNPVIAIVDLKDLPTQKEFELFRDYFESQGYDAVIAAPQDLEFDDDRLYFGSTAIDIVYKRLLVNEYLPIMDEYPALLNAYRAGAICMVNSFRGKLVHKKAIFAVLTNEKYEHLFDDQELAAINAHVPWTRKFREEQTANRGEQIDLVSWTRANSSEAGFETQRRLWRTWHLYWLERFRVGMGTKPSKQHWQMVTTLFRNG